MKPTTSLSFVNTKWEDIHKWIVRNYDDEPNFTELSNILKTNSVDDLTPLGSSPLHLAALGKNKYLLSYLIPMSSNINHQNNSGCTALHYACRSGNIENVCLLLKRGASGFIADSDKNTPLHYAVEGGYLEIVKYFVITKYCDVEAENVNGRSALDVACKEGEIEIASFLIKSGASIYKALIKSIRRNHPHIVLLFAQLSKVNWSLLRDENLRNPLHLAVLHNRFQIAHVLIKRNNAWLTEQDKSGLQPADYLHEFSDSRLAALFT